MPELVSVLIPAYNAERWLALAIRSALAQTWPRIEIIVVDDGSTDGTLAVAKVWESRAVKVITQENTGAAGARNTALAHAQGTYIQWLDADDLLAPNKIRAQMRVADEVSNREILLSCQFGTFYYRPQKAIFTPSPLWRDLTPIEYFMTRFTQNTCFQTDTWLVSRELTEAAGLWTDFGSPDDDGEYFCRVAMKSAGVRFVGEAQTYYRIGDPRSLNNARSEKAVVALYQSKAKCIKYLLSMEDSPRTRAASVQLLQDWIKQFIGHESLMAEARRLALELGGELRRPILKLKYRPVEALLGYGFAFRASHTLPTLRARTLRRFDSLLYRFSQPKDEPPASVLARRTKAVEGVVQ